MSELIEYPRDGADRHARTIARRSAARVQEALVEMIRKEHLPDIGILKLECMAKTLAKAAVRDGPGFSSSLAAC